MCSLGCISAVSRLYLGCISGRCRLCGGAIRPPKKTFCCDERVFTPALPLFSEEAPFTALAAGRRVRFSCRRESEEMSQSWAESRCVHFHLLRTSGPHVRKALALRDGRRCALCGVDCGARLAEICSRDL